MAKQKTVEYYQDVKVKCANCGSEYTLGTTSESLNIEICGGCHPFYTGKASLVDTAGRIEKFKARMNKAGEAPAKKAKKTKARKAKLSITDLAEEAKPEKKEKKATPKAKKAERVKEKPAETPEVKTEESKAGEAISEEKAE